MSNPLVDRILNNPLTFVSAKAPEKEVQTVKSAGYITLNSSASPINHSTAMAPRKSPKREDKRPKSMAEAIAAYTGKKYLTKNEKKRKLRVETPPEPEEESSNDETRYESASEFHDDSSFDGARDASGNAEDVGEILGGEIDESTGEESTEDSENIEESESADESESVEEQVHPQPKATILDTEMDEEEDDVDFSSKEGPTSSSSSSSSSPESSDNSESSESSESPEQPKIVETIVPFEETPEVTPETAASLENESGNDEDDDDDEDSIGQQNEDRLQLKKDLLQDMEKPLSDENTDAHEQASDNKSSSFAHTETHYMLAESEDTPVSGRITRKWTKPFKETKPAGLLNFGVTCYMNLAIQIMVHIPAIQHYLMEVVQGKHPQVPAKSVTHTFAELALRMWGVGTKKAGLRKYINPKKMVQRLDDINCMMSEWQQEDSHEYFMSLMSRLQEDSTPKGAKLNLSVLHDIFGGLLDQEVICQQCHTSSITKQEFYDLSLGLNKKRTRSNDDGEETHANSSKYTIEKSLKDFFSTETIRMDKSDASSGYYCEKCKQRTVATKKSVVERSPQTLMIHLKRFKFNGNSSLKVKQPIHYLKFLDLGPYSKNQTCIKYQLMGVIVHEGRSILSGHYVAHCYQPDGTWSTYDDEYINKIDEATALSDPSAYCLVYMKLEEKSRKRTKSAHGNTKRPRTT